jgi:WD40 repeat protein
MIYTTSIDGTVKKQDFEGKGGQCYLDTMNKDKWYTALDVSAKMGVMAIGSNTGEVLVKDLDGNSVWSSRAHKSKCHDIHFHPVESHYFVTAGNDKVRRQDMFHNLVHSQSHRWFDYGTCECCKRIKTSDRL